MANGKGLWTLDIRLWTPYQLLHAVILRIGNVKVSGGIQRDTPGIAEAARLGAWPAYDFERFILCAKHLDTAVAEFADVLTPGRIHANVVRIAQLAFANPCLSVSANKFPITRENLNAMIAGIGNINPIL